MVNNFSNIEEREKDLTEEQMLAMVKHIQESGVAYIKNNPEKCQKFLEDGAPPPEMDVMKLLNIVDVMMPETRHLPIHDLMKLLRKKLKVPIEWGYTLKVNNKFTDIYYSSLNNLWSALIRLNHDPEETLETISKIVLRKLNPKKKAQWWQFWK